MTETEVLRTFFKAWESQQEMPKAQGRPSPERRAAEELVRVAAKAVKDWKPDQEMMPAASAAYRALQQQVAAIPPKDTRGIASIKTDLNVTNG